MYKKVIFFVLVSLLLALPVLAYQSPGSPAGFVNDFASILSPNTKIQLEDKLKNFSGQESNEISVVTIKSLEGDTIENYAVKLFEEWKIGKAKQDNGVLLLVAPNDHQVRIEVGYGLEGALTDLQSQEIIQQIMMPAFRNGNYDDGISQGVDAIIAATKGEYTPASTTAPDANSKGNIFIGGGLLLFVIESISYSLRRAAKSKAIWPGALGGGIIGSIIGLIAAAGIMTIGFLIGGALLGLFIDYLLSRTKVGDNMRNGRGGGFFMGGMGGGGSGGGFGGFGGGSSGGGGASGRW